MAMDCKGCKVAGHSKEDCDYFKRGIPKYCNCQHRKTTTIEGPGGEKYVAPEGVTGVVNRG